MKPKVIVDEDIKPQTLDSYELPSYMVARMDDINTDADGLTKFVAAQQVYMANEFKKLAKAKHKWWKDVVCNVMHVEDEIESAAVLKGNWVYDGARVNKLSAEEFEKLNVQR